MTTATHIARELTAADLRWELTGPAPWPPSHAMLDVALEALGIVDDDLARGVIARMAGTIADLRDELRAVRLLQSVALRHAHEQDTQIQRLRDRLAERRETQPAASRTAA